MLSGNTFVHLNHSLTKIKRVLDAIITILFRNSAHVFFLFRCDSIYAILQILLNIRLGNLTKQLKKPNTIALQQLKNEKKSFTQS